MSNQAPKAIDWNSAESVVRAVFGDAKLDQNIRPDTRWTIYSLSRNLIISLTAKGLPKNAWKSARCHPEVARLDAARNAVLAAHAKNAAGIHVFIESYPLRAGESLKDQRPMYVVYVNSLELGSGPTEPAAWFRAASRIASAPSPDMKFDESWLRNAAKAESEAGFIGAGDTPYNRAIHAIVEAGAPVRSVEACYQPGGLKVVPMTAEMAIADLDRIHKDVQDKMHDGWDWMDAAFAVEALKAIIEDLRSQSHPSLQESGDASGMRAEATDSEWIMYLAYSEGYAESKNGHAETTLSGFLSQILPKLSKSPEPPAGPAFEEIARLVNSKSQPPAGEAETPEQKADWLIKAYAENGEEAKAMVSDYNGSAEDAAEDFARDFIRARQSLITALKVFAPIDLNATREEGWISAYIESQLPAFGVDRLVLTGDGDYRKARRLQDEVLEPYWWSERDDQMVHHVLYHGPLPAPPAFVQGIGAKP